VCLGSAFGQSCTPNNLLSYLNCIKGRLDTGYGAFETEFQNDFRSTMRSCFARNLDEAASINRCIFPDENFNVDVFGADGPLSTCQTCQKVASVVKDAFLGGSEADQTCIRGQLRHAIAQELQPCIRDKGFPNFVVPELPDFDAASYAFNRQIVDTTGLFVWAYYQIEECSRKTAGNAKSQNWPTDTKNCLENPTAGKYPQHCTAIRGCFSSSVNGACSNEFSNLERATCQCIQEKREFIKGRVRQIRDTVAAIMADPSGQRADKAGQCATTISTLLISPAGVDWKLVIGDTIKNCLGPRAPKLGVDKMLELGCRLAASRGDTGVQQLSIGFRFISTVVDALVARVSRFCKGTNCS